MRTTQLPIHEIADHEDLEAYNRENKSYDHLPLMKNINFGVISVNGRSLILFNFCRSRKLTRLSQQSIYYIIVEEGDQGIRE